MSDLFPDELAAKMPPLNSQLIGDDPLVHVRFFVPCSSWEWYGMEFDKENGRFFGWIVSQADERFGHFNLSDLEAVEIDVVLTDGVFGIATTIYAHRDKSWMPMSLSAAQRFYRNQDR